MNLAAKIFSIPNAIVKIERFDALLVCQLIFAIETFQSQHGQSSIVYKVKMKSTFKVGQKTASLQSMASCQYSRFKGLESGSRI